MLILPMQIRIPKISQMMRITEEFPYMNLMLDKLPCI